MKYKKKKFIYEKKPFIRNFNFFGLNEAHEEIVLVIHTYSFCTSKSHCASRSNLTNLVK